MNKILILLCVVVGLLGCSVDHSSETRQLAELPELTCVAVLPTMVPVSSTKNVTKASRQNLHTGAEYLDSQLKNKLGGQASFNVLEENRLEALLSNPWGGRIDQLQTIGQATGCGAILETSLSRYRQRVGNEMSAEIPASAAFSMELIGVKSGTVLWTASFDETQQALFDNILTFSTAERRGFRWLSVEELVSDGLVSRLQEFPYFKEEDI